MFDVDGDKGLICADYTIINIAERNMKDIVPLYYNMAKAGASLINNNTILEGLKMAYSGGNIGFNSNNITKVWNSDNINLEVIKLLCMETNFTVDYAKTLYKPVRPKNKKKLISQYTKDKTPHFFIYAKDKKRKQVEPINNSLVNRLSNIIPNTRIDFKMAGLGDFDYKVLMKNSDVKLNYDIIEKYKELDIKKYFSFSKSKDDDKNNYAYLYFIIRNKLLEVNPDINYIVDVLVKYLYEEKKSRFKETLWMSFGDIIVQNIIDNLSVPCEQCRKPIIRKSNRQKFCDDCWREIRMNKINENAKKYYHNKKDFIRLEK